MSTDVAPATPAAAHHGRQTSTLTYPTLVLAAVLSVVIGIIALLGSGRTADFFAWAVASPATAALVGAGFIGVAPTLFAASVRNLWEEVRIAVVPAGVLVIALLLVSLTHRDVLQTSDAGIIAFAVSWAWLGALGLLSALWVVSVLAQYREPRFDLARAAAFPRWAVPPVAVLGSALLGLGAALLVSPDFWGPLVPWEVSTLDARALGAWSLTLGVAVLLALAEDDLYRVKPGLYALVTVGALGLLGLLWHRSEVVWVSWSGAAALAVVGGLFVTGAVGLRLAKDVEAP